MKSILISGCSTGIGYYVAHALHKEGYRVFASARNIDDVERLKKEGLDAIQLDIANTESIQQAVKYVLDKTDGTLDVLFNNAGFGIGGAVEDLNRDTMRIQFETNVFGTLELTNALLPTMRQQGHGRIIQNSSVLGFMSMPYRGAYNASKYALEGWSDTLRQELIMHKTNIHVSLIEPGPIESEFRSNAFKNYLAYIDKSHSAHQENYAAMEKRLTKKGPAAPFTLSPEAVLKRVKHAMHAKQPKPRYYVTFPTYLFGYLKRILSTRMLDKIALKASGGGKN